MTDSKETKRLPKYQYGDQEYKNTHKHWQWPDGTSIHYNPEEGSETLVIHHSSGSYFEFRGTGTTVQFSPNNHVMYQKGGMTMSVDNNGDIKFSGHGRVNIDHDAHIEVAKNASIAVNGMAEVHSKGHVKFSAADIYLGTTQGSIVLASARDIEIKADKGRILQHSAGVNQLTTDSGDFHTEVGGKINLKAKDDINSETDKDISEKAGGKIIEKASDDITTETEGGEIKITAKKEITTKGKETRLQGGGPKVPKITVV